MAGSAGICQLMPGESPSGRRTHLAVVVRKAKEHQVRKGATHDSQRPHRVHDVLRRNIYLRVLAIERCSPVPERRHPDLLETLHDAGTQNPDFGSGTSFFTEIEAEEDESGSRSQRIEPGGNRGDDLLRTDERTVQ